MLLQPNAVQRHQSQHHAPLLPSAVHRAEQHDGNAGLHAAWKVYSLLLPRSYVLDLIYARFKLLYRVLHCIQLSQEVLHGKTGVRRQQRERRFQRSAAFHIERIARVIEGNAILAEAGENAVLEACDLSGQYHSGTKEFSYITNRTWRNPHRGQRPCSLQGVQSLGIESVGLFLMRQASFSLCGH